MRHSWESFILIYYSCFVFLHTLTKWLWLQRSCVLKYTLSPTPGASNYSGGVCVPRWPPEDRKGPNKMWFNKKPARNTRVWSVWGPILEPSLKEDTLGGVVLCWWSVGGVKSAQSGRWRCFTSTWRRLHLWNLRRTSWIFTFRLQVCSTGSSRRPRRQRESPI